MYLRNPYEKALAERVTETRYIVMQTSAHALRLGASDISYESLERQVVRLETELENLRLSPYVPSAPLTSEINRATRAEHTQAAAAIE